MKRIIYTLACLLLSVGAWAQNVAKIGTTEYATLKSALDAATNGETVTLIADVAAGVSVSATTNAKLDFNGYKITATSIGLQNYGTLELLDSKGTGGIDAKYAVRAESNSSTTIKSGSYSSVEGAVTLHTSVGETVTIDGGTFSASDNAVISGNGSNRTGTPGKVIIKAGTFNGAIVSGGYVACGIYAPWKDEFIVNGGTFNITNGCGILARAGSVTVNGGTFNTTGTATGKVGDSRVVVPCAAVVYDSEAGYPAMTTESKIEVPSTSTASFTSEVPAVAVVGDSHVAISGGTYSSPLTEDVCAAGYIPVTTPNSAGKYEAKAGTYVAQIGDVKYESLQEAMSAATASSTVKLLADVKLSSKLEVTCSDVTLDLNGKTISPADDNTVHDYCIVMVHRGAKLTVDDSSAEKKGSIDGGTGTNAFYGGIQLTQSADSPADAKASLVVNNGTIKGNVAAITGNGNRHNTEITINGGTFVASSTKIGDEGCAIYHPQDGTLTINGGTFTGYSSAVEMRSGTLNITDGEFTATATEFSEKANGNGVTVIGAALAVSQHKTNKDINVSISGGTFNGLKAVYEKDYQDSSSDNIAIAISGGTFNAEVSSVNVQNFISGGTFKNAVPEEYCAVGFIPQDNGNGTYGVTEKDYVAKIGDNKYESLADAIAAAQNGETVTLLSDVTENVTIPAGKNITLDLNGKTLSGGSVASNGKKAAILNYGSVVIKDSSVEQTGTIKRDDPENYDQSNSYYVIDNQGTMTIKSGTITNNAGLTTSHKGSSLIRNGEVAEGAVLNIEGGTLTQDNFDVIKNGGNNSVLNITGGTINSANSYAILSYDKVNMSAGTVTGKVCLRSYDSDYAVANISGGTINGNITVETYPDNTPTNLSECNISGTAVINGTLSVGEGNGNTFTANDENGTIAVSGGTFNNAVPEQYCADGFIPTDDGKGHYGVKNGSYVAQIGDVKYDTLAAAIAAAEDGTETTITLITDVIENITVPADKNIILDLNGKTLNGKQTANSPTIKNLGTLTVKNGNVRRTGEGSASYYVIENEGTITMGEGLNVEGSASASLIRNNAATAQMTFNDGTYTQTGAFIVVKNDLGNVVVNGGTFTTADNKNVLNNWDQMTVNGGTFTGGILNGAYDTDNNKLTINDGTFNTAKISTYIGNGKTTCPIEIKGGKFTNPDMTYAATGEDNAQVAVSGGTFANPVPEKYCAEGFIPKDNGNGTYGVKEGAYIARIGEQGYETLDAAIEAAKQEESETTITLLANAETEKETLPANVTIDANSKVLTMPSFVVLDGEAYTLPKITGADTYKVRTATYKRTNVSSTVWGTVCLPFSLTSGNGATYYTFGNISESTLTVNEATSVNPNTPVVFKKGTGDLTINEANATVSLVTPVTLESGALVGTYTDANITAKSNIYFINGDTFHKAQVSVKVPMYRAYINYPAPGAKPDVLNLNVIGIGNADGIESVVMDATNTAEAIYDVNGRQLTAPQKGLNIMKLANGKTVKVAVK